MTIHIYNTLTRQEEAFDPIHAGEARIYVCGPTVYDDCHIGHLMGPVLFDAVARWLRAREYNVRFVNNITDIDDKIIQRSLTTSEPWLDITKRYTQQYFEFLQELGVVTITDHPRCSEYIPQMIDYIQELVDQDKAYAADDGVYYDVQKQKGYGKLSGRKVEDMQAGARIDVNEQLRHPADFALWKKAKPGEPSWESPWGAGRPGWHLECSVMSTRLLGSEFDIHGGGDDLKFPHHENEIAQSEAHGDAFARVWMHNGLIQYGSVKIAKSDPRMKDPSFSQQFQARWLLDTYGAPTIRFFLLRGHYRRPIDFEPANLSAARTALLRLHKQLGELAAEESEPQLGEILARELPTEAAKVRDKFCSAMDQDFGTGEALAQVFTLAQQARQLEGNAQEQSLRLMRDLGRLLGIFLPGDTERLKTRSVGADSKEMAGLMDLVIELRQQARANKDFATADKIRDSLTALGIQIHDSKDGTTWSLED